MLNRVVSSSKSAKVFVSPLYQTDSRFSFIETKVIFSSAKVGGMIWVGLTIVAVGVSVGGMVGVGESVGVGVRVLTISGSVTGSVSGEGASVSVGNEVRVALFAGDAVGAGSSGSGLIEQAVSRSARRKRNLFMKNP